MEMKNPEPLVSSGIRAGDLYAKHAVDARQCGKNQVGGNRPAITSIGTSADRAWQRFRSAILERQRRPSAAIDLRIRHLREELVAALENGGAR